MKYEIIHLNGFMYAVPDSVKEYVERTKHNILSSEAMKGQIVATNDPSLNLPLLPAMEEDVEKLALSFYPEIKHLNQASHTDIEKQIGKRIGFTEGYKAAKAKQFTEEDMKKAYLSGYQRHEDQNLDMISLRGKNTPTTEQWLKSLKPLPIAVELGMQVITGKGHGKRETKILKIDENNFVNVLKWVYE